MQELIEIKDIIVPILVIFFTLTVLLIVRAFLIRFLQKFAKKTESKIDDIIIKATRFPSILWAFAIALYIGIAISPIPEKFGFYINRSIFVFLILSITIVAANLSSKLFREYLNRGVVQMPATGLVNATVKGLILIIGFLFILSGLGISITPLITALGVGGLAVALALQDTLANLFAGIHIIMERSIRVGDFIKLETGEQGYVDDITWRATRIRMLPNNTVIIPNSKLAQSIITNYYLPEKRMSLLIPIGVSYSSDPEHVERVLIEETMKAADEIPGLLKEPKPFVRFIPGFGESSLDFTLICQVAEFVDQYLVQHELRKRIFKRFQQEGIEIPFPHRTVYLREEKDWDKSL
jgi:small-conductance mechanosensitive channel